MDGLTMQTLVIASWFEPDGDGGRPVFRIRIREAEVDVVTATTSRNEVLNAVREWLMRTGPMATHSRS